MDSTVIATVLKAIKRSLTWAGKSELGERDERQEAEEAVQFELPFELLWMRHFGGEADDEFNPNW